MWMATHHMQTFLFLRASWKIKAQSHRSRAKGNSSSLQRCYTEAHPSHKLHSLHSLVYEATCRLQFSMYMHTCRYGVPGACGSTTQFDLSGFDSEIQIIICLLGTQHNARYVR